MTKFRRLIRFIAAGIFFLFLQLQALAQQVVVSGIMKSAASGETLAGVSIAADSIDGTQSDSAGNFSLSLPPGPHRLTFRLLGFREFQKEISLEAQRPLILSVVLFEAVKELGVVVVTAGKHEQKIEEVTVSMEVIKPALVENINTTTMESVIDQVPGTNVIDGQANIRGGAGWSYGAGSRVLVLVDDIPELSADAADAKWTFIPSENLEQIEVIKGASSALFGSSALNGVINFRTAYPKDKPLTKVGLYSGIYDKPVLDLGDKRYNLKWWGNTPQFVSGMNFLHSRQIKRFDLVAGGNVLIDDGYRQGEKEHRFRYNMNTRWRTRTEGLAVGLNFNIQTASGALFFIWKDDTTGAYVPANNTLSEYTNNKYSVDPYITYYDRKGNSHKLRSRYFNNTNTNNTNQNSTSEVLFTEYQYQRRMLNEKLTLTLGAVEQYSKVRSELYGNHSGNNVAGYLQADAKIQKFNFSAGGRVEKNRVDEFSDNAEAVFRAGINFHLFKHTYLRASAGQGYRFPSISERYVSTAVGQIGIYPNDSLSPEKGFSAEFGVKQALRMGAWQGFADVAVFLNRYKNMMEFAFAFWGMPSDPLSGLGFSAVNVGDTEIKGAEISISGSGAISKKVTLDLLAGYTYLDPRQKTYSDYYVQKVGPDQFLGSDSSNFLKYRYRHLFRADAEISYKKVGLGFSARYNSFMVNIDKVFTYSIGDLTGIQHYRDHRKRGDLVFDVRFSARLSSHWKAALICKNVFNYIYMQRPADMQPPRTYVIQLNLSL